MTAPNQGSDPTNIQGFADTDSTERQKEVWEPVSDRKIRMGIAGYGVCRFGTAFGFQHHPNVKWPPSATFTPTAALSWPPSAIAKPPTPL